MEDISLIMESIKPEQYKKLYKDLPIPSSTVSHNKDAYIDALTNSIYQKKLLNTMLNNGFNISHVTDNSISILLDIKNGQIIKYLREHLNSNEIQLKPKGGSSDVLDFEFTFNNERSIQILNQMIENYYLVNKSKPNEKTSEYILKLYQNSPKEYLDYIKEINKNEIEILKEQHLQQSTLPFNNANDVELLGKDEVSVRDIYSNDLVFNKIPFDKLTQEQKQVMCNKYFRKVLNSKLSDLNNKLTQIFGVKYKVDYQNQYEQNLGNYGIAGNTPPLDEKNINEIMVNMYPNVNYCSVNGEMAKLNDDLLGQIMITILHEHEHILQRSGRVDENLYNAVTNFESINPNGSESYFENYNKDPAEIDANLTSFDRFMEFSKYYGINNPDKIIMKKINNTIKNANETMNFYGDNRFASYNETRDYLNQLLQNSINTYTNQEQHGKSM